MSYERVLEFDTRNVCPCIKQTQFSSALDRPTGLRALAEMRLVPAGRDVRLGAADWALETAKVTSLRHYVPSRSLRSADS